MAFIFTPSEPIKYCQFSYEKFLDYVIENSNFMGLSFIDEWKRIWIRKLQKEDKDVIKLIKRLEHTNPLLIRAKEFPEQFKERNEMFLYEYKSGHGEDFYFHFDIESVKYYFNKIEPPKITLNSNEFYVDPETKFSEANLQDRRLPFFAQMFTIEKPYIVIDGNKRVMARLDKGMSNFMGYEATPDIVSQSFFTSLEKMFYLLLYEAKLFSIMMFEGRTSDEIKRYSIPFRYSNSNK